ncbi:MAG: 1-acyl-sn-glycerol-3-phosphate acyltransferase [Polyangia bacterium]
MSRPARFDPHDPSRPAAPAPPAATDYPLLRFRRERPDIVAETAERALSTVLRRTEPEYVLNDACLHEIRRLSESSPQEEVRELSEWKRLWRHLGGRSRTELLTELSKLVRDYAEDVAGGFSEPVYSLASHVLPRALALLLTPERLPSLGGHLLQPHKLDRFLGERLRVEGSLEHLRQLAQHGRSTLVCVPTHLSNLDSPVMGYALQAAGLPPSTYGAGKNLFTNPVLGFFMRNLGAYRVDRRIRHDLYKDVLKTYSQVILERGYHSMFFPGGTRSRSGRVESHLKLGLLGTTMTATIEGLRHKAGAAAGPAVRPMYIVPVTINAQLVLEAETLIADYLKETGKARFIIDDDESTQWRRIVDFMRSTMSHTGAIVVRFGAPLDVLGNPVDEAGRSLGPTGHPVELARYFRWRGQIQHVPQRDAEYMHETGEAITRSYRHNTVLMATHLLAHVMWRRIARALPRLDLYRRLRQPLELGVPEAEVLADLERLQALLRGRGHLLGPYASGTPKEALEAALAAFKSYHSAPAVLRQAPPETAGAPGAAPAPSGSAPIEPGDRQLLFYYQNRVESLGVEL